MTAFLFAVDTPDPFGDASGEALLARARAQGRAARDTHDLFSTPTTPDASARPSPSAPPAGARP